MIPWLTSDPANEFSAEEFFFGCFLDSANECFSGCARKHERSGHSTREVHSTLDRFFTSPLAKRQRPATEEEETYLE